MSANELARLKSAAYKQVSKLLEQRSRYKELTLVIIILIASTCLFYVR